MTKPKDDGLKYCPLCKVEPVRPYYEGKCEDCYLASLKSISDRIRGSKIVPAINIRRD